MEGPPKAVMDRAHMRPSFPSAKLLILAALAVSPASLLAQEDEEAIAPPPKQEPVKKEVPAEEPTSDVVGYKFPRGIYTQSDLGIFWRYLGFADKGGAEKCQRCQLPSYLVSNGQPFIGFSVGYDILPTIFDYIPSLKVPDIAKRFGVSAQLSIGTGYVAGAAPWSSARSAKEVGSQTDFRKNHPEESPKDHAILMAHPALAVNFIPPPFERVVLEGRVFFGAAAFSPATQRFERVFADPKWWLGTFGTDMGVGLSIKYMTLLTNFIIGSDLALYTLTSPGWGTELMIPPPSTGTGLGQGRVDQDTGVPFWGTFSAGPKRGNFIMPFVFASSFSPIIIKYVF